MTTDPYNPPQFKKIADLPENKGQNMEYPKALIKIQEQNYPDIAPRKSKLSADQTFRKCKEAGLSMSRWDLLSEDLGTYTLEFVVTSLLLRSKDDVIIQISPEKTGSTIHVRSRSRTGKGDPDANAERIRAFFQKLSESKG